ncbi:RDD family protein [Novosphingobium sp. 1949]|uniref:RDD family protein n=1 Tax=Novosphingobium organovorum TaxID=2930092 RepID=A0ABT0B9E3_9SPHN|nr:RDD family protein [Novosphingobium organovorum]MCJ2181554.1 RDD family protein [Novosphingobium organovorum]
MIARLKARRARQAALRRDASGLARTLVTPEGVTLSIAVASRGARIGALVLDLGLIVVLMIAISLGLMYVAGGTASIGRTVHSQSAAGYALQFLMIVWIIMMFFFRNAYFLFFELGPRGATPGKRLNGIRIAARDGGRLSAEMVIARNLLRDVELFLPLILLLSTGFESGPGWIAATAWFAIFLLFPLFNRDGLRAGDVIAGSWVLQAPRRKLDRALSLGPVATASASAPAAATATATATATARGTATGTTKAPAPEPAGAAMVASGYRFSEAELAVYGEFELKALERVLRDPKAKAIEPVYLAIAEKIGRNDGWNDEAAFLRAYYTQLRARLEAGMRMGVRKADKHASETLRGKDNP